MNVWTGRAVALTNPVLINPLTSQVYRLEPKKNGGFLRFESMPLMDYPLIITDSSIADLGLTQQLRINHRWTRMDTDLLLFVSGSTSIRVNL